MDKKLSYIAFYTDIHHEIKKITEGFRVTITLNLIIPKEFHSPIQKNITWQERQNKERKKEEPPKDLLGNVPNNVKLLNNQQVFNCKLLFKLNNLC